MQNLRDAVGVMVHQLSRVQHASDLKLPRRDSRAAGTVVREVLSSEPPELSPFTEVAYHGILAKPLRHSSRELVAELCVLLLLVACPRVSRYTLREGNVRSRAPAVHQTIRRTAEL